MQWLARYALPTIAFLLPWQTRWMYGQATIGGDPFELGVMSFYVVELLIVTTLALGIWLSWRDRTRVVRWCLGAFFAFAFLSAGWAMEPELVFAQGIHIVMAITLFVLVANTDASPRGIVWGFVLGLIAPVLLGVWQVAGGGSGASTELGLAVRDAQTLGDAVLMVGGERVLRAYGSFPHPNIFGGYLVMGLVGVTWLWSTANDQSRRWLAAIGIFLFVGLALTFSRSAWLALIVVMVVFAMYKLTRPWTGWRSWVSAAKGMRLGIAVCILVVACLSPLMASRFSLNEAIESRSIAERVAQYSDFGDVFAQHWFVGVGLGNYTETIAAQDPGRAWWEYQPVHNAWALLTAELGLVGLSIVIVVICALFYHTTHRFRNETRLFLLMGLVPLVIISLFDHYLWSLWPGLALIAFVAGVAIRIKNKPL